MRKAPLDFATWLAQTKQLAASIAGEVHDLSAELKQLQVKLETVHSDSTTLASTCDAMEGRNNLISKNSDIASTTRHELASLQHDVEIVITKALLYSVAGIDLAHLVEKIEDVFDTTLEQDGVAIVQELSTSPCDVAVSGQNSVGIPLRLDVLGNISKGSVHFNFCPRFAKPGEQKLTIRLARNPSACSSDFDAALNGRIEDQVSASLKKSLEGVSMDLPQIDFLPNLATFRATWVDDHLRCAGAYRTTARRRRALLPAVPVGYALAVKIDQQAVWDILRNEVASLGATVFGGPTVTGPKSFSMVAGFHESGSLKAGCTWVSWSVTVRVNLTFDVFVRAGRLLIISGRQVGDADWNIDIDPDILDWLLRDLKRKVEQYLADQTPPLGKIEKQFWIKAAKDCDVKFWDEFVVFALNV